MITWAFVAITFCIASWIVQAYRGVRWRVRLLWRAAYGVPWEWIARGEWRNPDLFYGRKPRHCILCGKPWLPFEDWIPVFGQIHERPKGNTGPGRHYDPYVSWPNAWEREIGWYVRDLHLWLPTGWLNDHVRFLCRRVHPRRYFRGFPIPMIVTDCFTGRRLELPTGPMIWNTLCYIGHWLWVHVRAGMVFAFLFFRVIWALLWSYCPIRGLRMAAYILDSPADRMLGGSFRWGFSGHATLWGRPADPIICYQAMRAWRRLQRMCRRLVTPKLWVSHRTRDQWRFFVAQWPTIRRQIPLPWRLPPAAYFTRPMGPLRYLWVAWCSCRPRESYFIADGIELDSYAPETCGVCSECYFVKEEIGIKGNDPATYYRAEDAGQP